VIVNILKQRRNVGNGLIRRIQMKDKQILKQAVCNFVRNFPSDIPCYHYTIARGLGLKKKRALKLIRELEKEKRLVPDI
jgi:hypothetical protein